MGYQLNKPISLITLLIDLKMNHDNVPDVIISNVATQDNYTDGSLSFTTKYQGDSLKAIFFVPKEFESVATKNTIYIKVDNPRLVFIKALNYLVEKVDFSHFCGQPMIHPSVKIGQNVVIEPGCVVDEGSIIEHNVVLHQGTRIGKYTRIRANASIGGDGFGFERLSDGIPIRFPHLGGVVIGDYVEIGSNTCVARGTLSDTVIKNYVKVDNLVHIAHNCILEEGAFITACAELSGGVVIGKNTWIGPNASIIQKLMIGENSLVGIGAVVTKPVKDNSIYAGNPARFIREMDK